jgi:non-heme chloroperoxidase
VACLARFGPTYGALFALAWFGIALGSTLAWKDPSPHTVRFVETEPGVKLEVLDWGGTGPSVLLLAGHGDTGHIFDDFAPGLTHEFHVLAVTRRGFGASSQLSRGYDLTTLVRDLIHVSETLQLKRLNLVGHSIAGDEMTRWARAEPDRVHKLVYLEAAYDRVEAHRLEAQFPKIPPAPPEDQETGSPAAIRARIARTEILMPEAEIRATRVFGPDEQLIRPVTPERIIRAVATMVEHPDYRAIRAPMLAMYAVYQNPAQLVARYHGADPETRRALEQVFALWQPFAKRQRDLLRQSVPKARVVEIEGASHYLFISNRKQVTQETRAFLQAP